MTTDIRFKLAVDGAAQAQGELNRTSGALASIERGTDVAATGVQRLDRSLRGMVGLVGGVGLAAVAATAARAFIGTADSVTQVNNQLRLAEGSAGGAASAYGRLFAIAQQSRLSFTDLAGTYARISRSTSELGISQQRLLGITQAIGNAVAVSGSSAEAANAALMQLGQGLSSGALRGDELNSVMEQTPRLARAIADGLGVTTGELRKMGEQGELTAQKIIGALESQAGVLNKELAGTVSTFAQAMTQLGNAATLLVGQVNKATGASGAAGGLVKGFARDLQAASEAMAIAERRGGGFWRQLNDGAGILLGRSLGLQLINRDFMTLQGSVDDARATIARLDEQERTQGKLSIYAMSERAEAMRDLARASRELSAAAGPSSAGSGSVRSGDTALAAAQAADEARRRKLADAELKKYATPSEKFAEAVRAASAQLGDQFTPELAARMREHYIKPTNEAAEAAKRAAQAHKDWISQRGLFELRRQDEAQAAADAAAERALQDERELQSKRGLAYLKRVDDAEEAADKAAQAEIDAQKKASAEALADWQRTNDQIGQSLADALMGGAQSAAQAMVNLFRTIVLRPVVQALVNPTAGVVSSALGFGGPAAAAGNTASSLGGIGNVLSLAGGALGTFGTTLGAGAAATLGGASLGSLLGASGAAIGNGAIAAGVGLGVGAAIPYIGAAVAAYYVGKKLFGKTLEDSGVQGTFSGSGFSGQSFEEYKRIIGNDSTKRRPLSGAVDEVFDAGALAARESIQGYAKALGLSADAITGYTQKIRFSTKGQSDKDTQAEIQRFIGSYAEGLAGVYKKELAALQRDGEKLAETLQRLAGIQTFSSTLNDLGGVFARVARTSIDAREELFKLAGGMEQFGQQALQFVQDYYGRDEIAGIKAAEVQRTLAGVGVTQDVASREQFRALVDGTDVSTAAGRQQLATLLAASSAFTSVADYLAETGKSLAQAAEQAPQTGALAGLFGPNGQLEQISAINNVATSVDRVYEAVVELIGVSKQKAPAPVFAMTEVGGYYDRS
jgi:tape measure domain-containing protein